MRHGSLFSGIGGFDLAAEWMNWTNVFHCEWNKFGQQVLKHHFPKSISYDDITKTDFTIHRGDIDILTGGFPCQPYSMAGKRLGKEDERHLWPEMLRVIRETSPSYVVGENVRGLVNWNGGMVFDEVQADLEALGYEVLPFLLPACAVGAPHRRDRVWFIAYRDIAPTKYKVSTGGDMSSSKSNNGNASDTDRIRLQQCENTTEMGRGQSEICRTGNKFTNAIETNGKAANVTNAESVCLQGHSNGQGQEQPRRSDWSRFPTEPAICGGDDGLPTELDGITFSKWRNESIKAYGNAIVPQVALEIFKAIQAIENLKHT